MPKTKPLVSIIVPMYNSSPYIEECIESIVSQDYPQIELLLIDDHSTDNTAVLCSKYVDNTRIRLLFNNKKGVSSARNLGITEANGEYLAFVDSDDVVARTYISALYKLSIAYPDYLAVCGLRGFNNKLPDFNEHETDRLQKMDTSETLANIYYYHSSACAALFRSDIIKEYKILMVENADFNEDVYFTSKYLCACKGAISLSNRLYGYRVNPVGLGANKSHYDLTAADVEHRARGYISLQDALAFARSNAPEYVEYIDVGYSFIAAEVILTSARAKCKKYNLKKEIKGHLTLKYCIKFLKHSKSLSQKLLVVGIAVSPSMIKFVLDDLGLLNIKKRHNKFRTY